MLVATLGLLVQMAVVPHEEARVGERAARDARSAQQRFERFRRANLPRKPGGGTTDRCEAHIGRFCYWYDSTETDAEPEPQRIEEARLTLLATLDSAAARTPQDPWIAGQRVRYYIEAGRMDDAAQVGRTCRADAWWCAALTGLAEHVAQRYVAADSAFAVALATMPEAQRCEWIDITVIDGRWRRAFRDASCERREEMANIAFTLGRPLWIVDGNDLRTEHFARRTMALVYERSANAYGMSFGSDSRELMLRYGWPEWYTRHDLSVTTYPSFAVTGHDREPTYYFFPDVPDLATARPDGSSWRLRETPAPTRYAPRHIERLTHLPHQLGRFPRGDSMLIVARFRVADSILEHDRLMPALAVRRGRQVSVVARAPVGDRAIAGMVAKDTIIVSIEVLGDSTKHASRARYSITPLSCSEWCLSDLLIVDPTRIDSSAGPIEAAAAAYPERRVDGSAAVAVFFELERVGHAVSNARPASFTLTITPMRVTFARRVAASLRLADRPEAVRMRWQGTVGATGDRERHVVGLHIPASARGSYRMQLTVTPRGTAALTAARELEIVR